jgi:hypothetical protein
MKFRFAPSYGKIEAGEGAWSAVWADCCKFTHFIVEVEHMVDEVKAISL